MVARRQLLIFTEGHNTEVDYLTYWYRRYRSSVLLTIDERHGRDPLTLVRLAVGAKVAAERDARRGNGKAWDEIWCVFDVDEHKTLDAAVDLAGAHGVHLAISSPCFELWLLLHYGDHRRWIDRHEAQRAFHAESRTVGRSLGPATMDALAVEFDAAKTRASLLEVTHSRDGNGSQANPGSGVWKLVDSIAGRRSKVEG